PFAAYSPAMRSRPTLIACTSSCETMPCLPSIATCAFDAAMSCRHSALSKGIEAFISRMIALGPSAKRPPHIWLEPPLDRSLSRLPSLSLTLAVLGLAVINGGCDRQSQPPAQPAAKEQANAGSPATAAGSPDRSHAGSRLPDCTFADPDGQKL